MIWVNRYQSPPKPVYEELYNLVKDKDYFVLTTNVDHCFQKAGFAKERLFYTQGDFGLFQCSLPCRQETFDNEDAVRAMLRTQKDMRIPSELMPHCPHCGRPMTMNLRANGTFAETKAGTGRRSATIVFCRRERENVCSSLSSEWGITRRRSSSFRSGRQ